MVAAAVDANERLNPQANSPIASLGVISITDVVTSGYRTGANPPSTDGSFGNALVIRGLLPFDTGRLHQLMRWTVPVVTNAPGAPGGLADLEGFDLALFDTSFGRWGVGLSTTLPTASNPSLGLGNWTVGPAIGVMAHVGPVLLGVLNENFFGLVADAGRERVFVTYVQPFMTWLMPQGWYLGMSEMTFEFRWQAMQFAHLPIGFRIGKVHRFGGQAVNFALQGEHDFAQAVGTAGWTVRFAFAFLFPSH